MDASRDNVSFLGANLDHPESVFVDADGTVYAGGEAGQVYRISVDGEQRLLGTTGGNLLGLVVDGDGVVHCCDCAQAAVFSVAADGEVRERSRGTADRPMRFPNHPVFDAEGNLYVSDSGSYWEPDGCIYRIRPDDTTELFHAGPLHYPNGIAIDPTQRWLYIAQSPAWNVVRISLEAPDSPVELAFELPEHTIPDGMWFSADGRLHIGCYRPDQVIACHPDGRVEVVIRDRTAELILAPTNVFPHEGKLYIANLGGYHISVVETGAQRGTVHQPSLRSGRAR
ncbi:SMP-30/gluconolactonase/LRE family protein [Enhygromyxa salina]|uniref:SMP-30/Gluconolaconase/LRE-like region n=1 Tax=Enhygromyxa salina TaxID=215803 RepID=A0A2S9Y5V2_9BACT|nr:SMP-30/gluconolactonase/LRE family protein [Enhygromyxa salina]PRQ00483.1 SMP-30/Gluconolaconase/LRE-like region [Enhygromyxa salina]